MARPILFLSSLLLLALVVLPLGACGGGGEELVIYTSIYPEVIESMEPELEKAFPGVAFEWRQMGSEQLAVKLAVELDAGGTRCDLLMTSDPFFYAQLAEAGHLATYESAAASGVSAAMKDHAHRWATVRVPVMVIGVNHDKLGKAEHPTSFADLRDPRFKGKLAMGDPLKSGTTFTTVAALVRKYGWAYFEDLHKNEIQSAGGNSTVTGKIETGERPVGIALLENLLPRVAQGAPITVIYPADGAVPVPSPVAILKSSDQPELARKVFDYMFTPAMQAAIVAGYMYSPVPGSAPPAGAAPWSELALFDWNADFMDWVKQERQAIKKQFRETLCR